MSYNDEDEIIWGDGDCPDCNGTGYDFVTGKCLECDGTGNLGG